MPLPARGTDFMKRLALLFVAVLFAPLFVFSEPQPRAEKFPAELVKFVPAGKEPVFQAAEKGKWDEKIRERGWIMREDGIWKLWYTGYDGTADGIRMLGYATSPDGIKWTRHPK